MRRLDLVADVLLLVVAVFLVVDSFKQWRRINELTEQHNVLVNDMRNVCAQLNRHDLMLVNDRAKRLDGVTPAEKGVVR